MSKFGNVLSFGVLRLAFGKLERKNTASTPEKIQREMVKRKMGFKG